MEVLKLYYEDVGPQDSNGLYDFYYPYNIYRFRRGTERLIARQYTDDDGSVSFLRREEKKPGAGWKSVGLDGDIINNRLFHDAVHHLIVKEEVPQVKFLNPHGALAYTPVDLSLIRPTSDTEDQGIDPATSKDIARAEFNEFLSKVPDSDTELDAWFDKLQDVLESAYTTTEEPWKQSGFSGPKERWDACRRPIASCIEKNGTFLDIGCANGYLLECLFRWAKEAKFEIEPHGLDISGKLLDLARERLPGYSENLYHGNAIDWNPSQKFDYVRTELCYVPTNHQKAFADRILDEFVKDDGRLLIAEYRSRSETQDGPWIDRKLIEMGFKVRGYASGYWEGKELTRVAIIDKDPKAGVDKFGG